MKTSFALFIMLMVTLSARPLLRSVAAFSMASPSTIRRQSRALFSSSSSSDSVDDAVNGNSRDPLAEYRNENNANDQLFSGISMDGGVKVAALTCRNIMNECMVMHSMTEVPAAALGRLMTCALLCSNGMQDEQTLQITLSGDGPLRGAMAIANGVGEVRGYAGSPAVGSMTLSEAVGKGTVQVVKNHPEWPNPYNGITSIRHGDIDRDIGLYLAESEQRSCALAAATAIHEDGILCKAAGGYLVEKLPGCTDETMKKVEENLANLVKMDGGDNLPTGLLLRGVTPVNIVEIILDGLDMQPLQQIEPRYVCLCTEDRLFRALRLLPREEVDDILEKQEQIEARCHFCGKVYRMSPDQVEARFAAATGDPSQD